MGGVVDTVKDIGQGAIDIGRGSVGFVADVAQGKSTKDSISKIGGGANDFINSSFEMSLGGADGAALVNKYSGGMVDKVNMASSGVGNLIEGKSVSGNIKAAASLGLQAGQAYVGANGVNLGGQDFSGLANNILGGLNNKLNGGGQSQAPAPAPAQAPSYSQGSYNGASSQTNFLPYILIGGVVLIGAILLLKKKK